MAEKALTPQHSRDTSEAAALSAMEGLLDLAGDDLPRYDEGGDDTYQPGANAVEEGFAPEEEQVVAERDAPSDDDEHDDGELEPEVLPAIEAPRSWPAEKQARFKEIPPDLQELIAEREIERERSVNVRLQNVAEQRKAIEAESAKQSQLQQQYAQTLNALFAQSYPELQQLEQVDLVKLAETDPNEATRLNLKKQAMQQRLGFMAQQYQQAQQVQAQQYQQQYQARLADEYQKLMNDVPDFNDPGKAQTIIHDITSTLARYGFSEAELGAVGDARVVRVMARLAELEKLNAARKSAQTKRGGAPASKAITPNAAPSRDRNTNRAKQDAWNKFEKSKSTQDAASIVEMML